MGWPARQKRDVYGKRKSLCRRPSHETYYTIGIDLTKNSFSVYGADAKGKPVLQRTLIRSGVVRLFANLPECVVGMEA